MNATIGVMTKRINSTKQTFTGASHACVMKDPQSRETPTFLVTGAPMQHSNYMSFNGWYYWIDDVISETNNMYRIMAHVDPLATWKTAIKNTGAFVKYCSDMQMTAGNMDDPRLAPGHTKSTTHNLIDPDFLDFKNGTIILSAYAWEGAASGGHREYAMTQDNFIEMLKDFNNELGTTFDSTFSMEELFCNMFLKAGGSTWKENIQGCIYVPIPYSRFPGTAQSVVYVGGFHSNVDCKVLNRNEMLHIGPTGQFFTMPASYFSGNLKEILNCARFTVGELVHPGGVVPVKSSMFEYSDDECAAYIYFSILYNTGEYCISLESGEDIFAIATGNLSYDMMKFVVSGSMCLRLFYLAYYPP